ncbi:uncharacterized protein LOC109726993 isoform X1 [Ananas comosus]|uniref:Increased DNA methylation 1 n=1 Tax=Ananas comosus TaxID=4615 RepID=A0A199VVU3_ANACO|nr:uncharacterized protein LOC109726993 isoform X1 [Ananas comosus]OAY81113.1 Increased DNA methylation 1 [Ananas comosus]
MANGDGPSDSEDYVLRSGVRAGLKREFAFALKAQAELPPSLGRTRSRSSSASAAAASGAASRGSKKPKRSGDGGDQPSSKGASPPPQPVTLPPLPPPPPPPPPSTPSPVEAEAPNVAECRDVSAGEARVKENGSAPESDAVVMDEPISIAASPVGKPNCLFTSSESKVISEVSEALVVSVSPPPPPPPPLNDKPIEFDGSGSAESNIEKVALESSCVTMAQAVSAAKPTRRFTRSLLNNKAEDAVAGPEATVSNGLDSKVSSVKQEKVPVNYQVVENVSNIPAEKPIRRFTRSLLKDKAEGATVSNGSVGSEETKDGEQDTDGLLSSPNKMELKMSKKIRLRRIPGNVRDLLATGLLEGLPVKYYIPNGKQPELHGVIRGNNILCSCASCNGSRAVSPYNFELHAGSTKKHPSDYIILENGNSMRDVLKACANVSLATLEDAIQNAIGPLPAERSYTCQKCKQSFLTSRTGKLALLCDVCLDSKAKQPRKTPSPSNANASGSRLPREGSVPSVLDSSLKNTSAKKKICSTGKLTRKDLGLHKLVFMNDILPEGTEVGYYVGGKRLLEGYIKDNGIYCHCCNTVVSPSQFEAHAGRASRRKPYNNIYTSNGVSLHELSVSLSKDRKLSPSENDDLCGICADGGNLLLCDLCPRAFHKECIGLSAIPKGDWYCQYCQSLHQRERALAHNDNAIAAGRVAGVDPIEQIYKRCIRIVTTAQTNVGGCALCRLHDFSKSRFDARTVLLCDQCEKEYHVGCLKEHNMADLKELPEGEWFCCANCSRIHAALQDFLLQGAEALPSVDADVIKKKYDEKGLTKDADTDIRWRLLSGRDASADTKLLLSRAVAIFHESFDPIVEATTGRDLIPVMVYGRTVRDQDYSGMYCAVLTVGSSVVSAGILRIMGCQVAELPLVATSRDSQGLGYFQSLFSCIERLLVSLKVKHFILPAADEAESIWTKRFGFSKITSEQLVEYLNGARTTVFQGTSVLHKPVLLS